MANTPAPIEILSLADVPLVAVVNFTDVWIGTNYYSLQDLQEVAEHSCSQGQCASLVAKQGGEIIGIRLSYAPGELVKSMKGGITPTQWRRPPESVAYFKSLFVHSGHQGLGLGQDLSHRSLAILRAMGAQAVVCHSWLESPGNSSQTYLQKMGFTAIKEHPLFWNHLDYDCTRCAPARCVCTAMEMIKYI